MRILHRYSLQKRYSGLQRQHTLMLSGQLPTIKGYASSSCTKHRSTQSNDSMISTRQFQHAVFPGNEQIVLNHSDMPVAEHGEVLIRVLRTALCGSDNRLWRNGASQIPGHEIFGVVNQADHPRHGERVCIYIPVYCGHCHACTRGFTQSCETWSVLVGWNRDGGFAEYVVVPEQCLLPVPAQIEDRLAPLLLDTIGTSAHAVRMAGRFLDTLDAADHARRRVLIYGAGPIGLGVLTALLDCGYADVQIFDPTASRASFARSMGALPLQADENRRYDCIFECSGSHQARDEAITRIAPGGVIVLIGENSAPWALQEGPVFRRKDFMLLRSFYFPVSEHQDNIALLLRQREAYQKIADVEITLDELPEAYRLFVAGETLKPVLTFAN